MHETILNKLKQEHLQVAELMTKIQAASEPTRKRELYSELKHALIPHMEGEEQTLYAHLRDDTDDVVAEKIVKVADQEHHEVKDLLTKLDRINISSPDWDSTFATLKADVEQHVNEEESDLFAEAKEDFSREELEKIGDEFDEVKSHSSF